MPRRSGVAALVVVLTVLLGPAPATGQRAPEPSPQLALDRREAQVGEVVVATMSGLEGESVILTVCGNQAARGSQDCANSSAVGDELVPGGPSYTQITVQPPPAPCPCVVRAVASGARDVVVAPLTIVGHPVGPVIVPSNEPLVDIRVVPRRAGGDLMSSLRAALGGRTRFAVAVTVHNRSTQTLEHLALSGSVTSWSDNEAAILELDVPAGLQPGETWSRQVVAEVDAPALGRFRFEVVAAGAGPTVMVASSLSNQPRVLWALLAVLVLDVVVAADRGIRRASRRRAAIEAELVA